MSILLRQEIFYLGQILYGLLLLFLLSTSSQNNFFILLRKFLRINQIILNQKQTLKPIFIKY